MCVYYHASHERYVVGQTISIEDFQGETTLDHARRLPEEKDVNDLLDANRPPKVLYSRKRCIFLFENLQQCMYYASNLPSQNIRIYKTHSNDTVFGGFPICRTWCIKPLINYKTNTYLNIGHQHKSGGLKNI